MCDFQHCQQPGNTFECFKQHMKSMRGTFRRLQEGYDKQINTRKKRNTCNKKRTEAEDGFEDDYQDVMDFDFDFELVVCLGKLFSPI